MAMRTFQQVPGQDDLRERLRRDLAEIRGQGVAPQEDLQTRLRRDLAEIRGQGSAPPTPAPVAPSVPMSADQANLLSQSVAQSSSRITQVPEPASQGAASALVTPRNRHATPEQPTGIPADVLEAGRDVYQAPIVPEPAPVAEPEREARSIREIPGAIGRGIASGTAGLMQYVGTAQKALGAFAGLAGNYNVAERLREEGGETVEFWEKKAQDLELPEDLQGRIADDPSLMRDPYWLAYGVANIVPGMALSMLAGVGGGKAITAIGGKIPWTPAVVSRLAKVGKWMGVTDLSSAALKGGAVVGGAVGGSLEGAQTFEEVMKLTGDDRLALAAGSAMTLAAGALNAISLEKMLSPAEMGLVRKFLATGATEAVTEYAEEPTEVAIKALLTGGIFTAEMAKDQIVSGLNVVPLAFISGGLGGAGGTVIQRRDDAAEAASKEENEALYNFLSAEKTGDAVAMDAAAGVLEKHGVTITPLPKVDAASEAELGGVSGVGARVETPGLAPEPVAPVAARPMQDSPQEFFKPVRPAKEDLRELIDANFGNGGRVSGDESVPIGDLSGGAASSKRATDRIDAIAESMSSPDGYIERLVVDQDNNVIEGAHRLEALRQIGVTDVPVTRVVDTAADIDVPAMKASIARVGKLPSDHVNQIVTQVGEMLDEVGGDPARVLAEYELPSGFEAHFKAALESMVVQPGAAPESQPQGLGSVLPETTPDYSITTDGDGITTYRGRDGVKAGLGAAFGPRPPTPEGMVPEPTGARRFGEPAQAQTTWRARTPSQAVEGKDESTYFPGDGRSVSTRYTVVEARDLYASNDPQSFAQRPAAEYPPTIQGRAYHGERGRQAREDVIMQSDPNKFDVVRALDTTVQVTGGVPTITPSGVVVAGNQRAMMVQRALDDPAVRQKYQESLRTRAAEFGLGADAIDGFTNPVLVRVVTDPTLDLTDEATLKALNAASDVTDTKTKDLLSDAATRAGQLKAAPRTMDHFMDTSQADQTLREYMDTSSGMQFVGLLLEENVIASSERAGWMDAEGVLTDNGRDAMERVFRVAAIGDADALATAPKSALAKLDSSLGALVQARAVGEEWGLGPALVDGFSVLNAARELGWSVDATLTQSGMFGDIDPFSAAVAKFMEKPVSEIRPALKRYAAWARDAEGQQSNEDMFDTAPTTPAAAQKAIFGVAPDQGGLGPLREEGAAYNERVPGEVVTGLTGKWYSRLQRAVERGPGKSTGKEWDKYLNPSKRGFGEMEADWSGVREWLTENADTKLTRNQVLEFAREHGIKMEATVKGDRPRPSKDVRQAARAALRAEGDLGYDNTVAAMADIARDGGSDLSQWEWQDPANREAVQEWLDVQGDRLASKTLYQGTTVKGIPLKGYKETLVKLAAERYSVRTRDDGKYEVVDRAGTRRGPIRDNRVDALASARAFADVPIEYTSAHWSGDPGTMAHVRSSEVTVPGDEGTAKFVHEFQSDQHQVARDEAIKAAGGKEEWAKLTEQERNEKTLAQYKGAVKPGPLTATVNAEGNWEVMEGDNLIATYKTGTEEEALDKARQGYQFYTTLSRGAVPNAPYKATDEWLGLMVRQALQEAVADGNTRLIWANGEQAAALYDLRQHVSRIEWDENAGELVAYDLDGAAALQERDVTADNLAAYIGKGPAERLLAAESGPGKTGAAEYVVTDNNANEVIGSGATEAEAWTDVRDRWVDPGMTDKEIDDLMGSFREDGTFDVSSRPTYSGDEVGWRSIKGDDLAVGGEGMLEFYDRRVSSVIMKEAKALGVKVEVEPVQVAEGTEVPSEDYDVFNTVTGESYGRYATEAEAERAVEMEYAGGGAADWGKTKMSAPTNLSIRITPELREAIQGGMRLAEEGAGYGADLFGNPVAGAETQGDLLAQGAPQGMSIALDNARAVTSILQAKFDAGALNESDARRFKDAQRLLRASEGRGIDPSEVARAETMPADEFTLDMFPPSTPKSVRQQHELVFGSIEAAVQVNKDMIRIAPSLVQTSLPGVMDAAVRIRAVEAGREAGRAFVPATGHKLASVDGVVDEEKTFELLRAFRHPAAEYDNTIVIGPEVDGFREVVSHRFTTIGAVDMAIVSDADFVEALAMAKRIGGKVISAHNHPSGIPKPSRGDGDIHITRQYIKMARNMGAEFDSHYVIDTDTAVRITPDNIEDMDVALDGMGIEPQEIQALVDRFGVRLDVGESPLEWVTAGARRIKGDSDVLGVLKGLPVDAQRMDVLLLDHMNQIVGYEPRHIDDVELMDTWLPGLMRDAAAPKVILGVKGNPAFQRAIAGMRAAPFNILDIVDIEGEVGRSAQRSAILPEVMGKTMLEGVGSAVREEGGNYEVPSGQVGREAGAGAGSQDLVREDSADYTAGRVPNIRLAGEPKRLVPDDVERDYTDEVKELVKAVPRHYRFRKDTAKRDALKWRKSLTSEQREDIGAAVEGIGNIRTGKTAAAIHAEIEADPSLKSTLSEYKRKQSQARDDLNAFLADIHGPEYVKYVENYLLHAYIGKKGKTVSGFTKKWTSKVRSAAQRRIPTLKEAVEYGLVPITQDVADLHQLWAEMNWRGAVNQQFVHELTAIKNDEGIPIIQLPKNAPDDWVPVDHPAIQKVYATKTKDGETMLWRGGARVEPEAYKVLQQVFEQPLTHPVVKTAETFNAFAKKAALSFSFFHHFALTESAQGALARKYNPLRGIVLAERGLRGGVSLPGGFKLTTPHREGLRLLDVKGFAQDAALAGLNIDPIPDVQAGKVKDALRRVEARARGVKGLEQFTRGVRRLNDKWDEVLWDRYYSGLKAFSYYSIVEEQLKLMPNDLPAPQVRQVKEKVAELANDMYGGQEWAAKFWLTPQGRQAMHLLLLAPDWTLSNLNVAVKGVKSIGGKGDPVTQRVLGTYWRNMLLSFFALVAGMNKALSDKWPWENEPDHKVDIDVTDIMKKMPWTDPDDERRYYVKTGKQFREVLRYIENPVDIVGAKLSPGIQVAIEQMSGHQSGQSGWEMPWAREEMGFYGSLAPRAMSVMEKFVPFAARGNNFALTFPLSRGMSWYKAQKAYEDVIRAQVDPSLYDRLMPGADADRLKAEVDAAAELNGLDAEDLFKQANTLVRSTYYGEMWGALERKDMKSAERYAEILKKLGATNASMRTSGERRDVPRENIERVAPLSGGRSRPTRPTRPGPPSR